MELYSTSEANIIKSIHKNFDLSIFCINPRYNAINKSHWPAKDPCQFTLNIKIGATKKKMDPIIEYRSELVNFFSILNEKKDRIFAELFEILDSDGDGEISSSKMDTSKLNQNILKRKLKFDRNLNRNDRIIEEL